jgi:hypothetical protein
VAIRVAQQDDLGGFGDARRRKVGAALLAAMQQRPSMCLHALAESRQQAKQFGQFLDNPAVSADEMLVHAGRLTGARATGRHVLAIQDTTELHFATHTASKRGFGTGGNGKDIGLFLHPLIVVDAIQGGLIGLACAEIMNRTQGPAPDRRRRPAEDKESYRWLTTTHTGADVLAQAARITVIADREGDIYDLFARRPARADLLIRAAQDRRLIDLDERMFTHIATLAEQERSQISVPPKGGRPVRRATVALRFGEVTLARPRQADPALPPSLALRVVDVTEVDAPPGAEPVHWCLLTTHAVATPSDARQIVAWYQQRWTIEQVFRTLKADGVRIEDSQIIEARSFVKLAVVALIAAVRVMQIVLGRDGSTGQPLIDAVDTHHAPALAAINRKLEGKTEKLKNPHDPQSLAWLAWIVARLGGWSGYTSKGYKPPGPKTIIRGLNRLDGMIQGWNLANHSELVGLP